MKRLYWIALFFCVAAVAEGQTASNDHIFPASAAAKAFVDFDPAGFLVKGKRTYLVSAGLEYARVPHELWRDRLMRLKRAGFNCVEIYTFWNWHEPKEGEFDFSGDHDLEGFLKLAASLDLYVIARVGPYYCAEWDNGGYPLWLRFKEGVEVRKDNAAFLKYVDRFFEHLMPIVARNQINHGGSVIMVQLENEHNDGWGTAMPNGYFRHLREKALALGLEVPYFFSGLHHASDPVGDTKALDEEPRPNPWFTTEFWSVWYNAYGSGTREAREYERRTWKIISRGAGGGYNYYMAYGGSNFGYTNNDEDAASYDYGAAVGQAGDLRPIYYSFKRLGWFARSFQDILSNTKYGTLEYHGDTLNAAVRTSTSWSDAGDIEFYDNGSDTAVMVDTWHKGWVAHILLEPGDVFPVVHDFAVTPSVKLEWAPVRILGIQGGERSKTIVAYGRPGANARLEFAVKGTLVVEKGKGLIVSRGRMVVNSKIPAGTVPVEWVVRAGNERIRVLVMNKEMADRTWFVGDEAVTGPYYMGEGVEERPYSVKPAAEREVKLGEWLVKTVSDPAAVLFDDAGWKKGEWPLQMGADGDQSPDAWYRTTIEAATDGEYVLQIEGGDRGTVFVDGVLAGVVNLHEGEIGLQLTKGRHVLAVFTAHDGRDKLAAFVGDMSTVDMKGLTGRPRLERGAPSSHELGAWRFLKAADVNAAGRGLPTGTEAGWTDYTIGKDVFAQKEGYGWFRTELPAPPAGAGKGILKFRSVDENATVFINGRRVLHHEGWNLPFQVALEGLDTMARPIVLTVFIENHSNEGGIDRAVRVNYFRDAVDVKGWSMKGGIAEPGMLAGWIPQGKLTPGLPRYYRTSFRLPAYGKTGAHTIWRVQTKGLGHGSVWVNGHNLGRYPEKVPAPGMYIPECWLQGGENELVIYDEDGASPAGVRVESEAAAGRWIENYIKQ